MIQADIYYYSEQTMGHQEGELGITLQRKQFESTNK